MAIVQVSRIQHRKGLYENLPQLAGAEFGWATDARRLFIGNGTLEDGAPIIGNTEILTEHSNILEIASSYTYKGEAAGYIVQTTAVPGQDIIRTLQSKLDEYVSVRDFGAVGDGVTDDTAAINRALFQLYCRGSTTESRRILFFPAGQYIVSSELLIPPFATLVGEGIDGSIIQFQLGEGEVLDPASYVARTTDSNQATGANIGIDGAIVPQSVSVSKLSFRSTEENNIFLLEQCENVRFSEVAFVGSNSGNPLLGNGVEYQGTVRHITFDHTYVRNIGFGHRMIGNVTAVNITNSVFDTLGRGLVALGTQRGVKLTQNLVRNVSVVGFEFGPNAERNISAFNTFTTNAASTLVSFGADNNVSIGDMYLTGEINTGNTTSIAFDLTNAIRVGRYKRETGRAVPIDANVSPGTQLLGLSALDYRTFSIDYLARRGTAERVGKLKVAIRQDPQDPIWDEEYVENTNTGFDIYFTRTGNSITMHYTLTDNPSTAGTFIYSIEQLN